MPMPFCRMMLPTPPGVLKSFGASIRSAAPLRSEKTTTHGPGVCVMLAPRNLIELGTNAATSVAAKPCVASGLLAVDFRPAQQRRCVSAGRLWSPAGPACVRTTTSCTSLLITFPARWYQNGGCASRDLISTPQLPEIRPHSVACYRPMRGRIPAAIESLHLTVWDGNAARQKENGSEHGAGTRGRPRIDRHGGLAAQSCGRARIRWPKVRPQLGAGDAGRLLDLRRKLRWHAALGARQPVPDLRLRGSDAVGQGLLAPGGNDCSFQCGC